jgi:hypothetical protein
MVEELSRVGAVPTHGREGVGQREGERLELGERDVVRSVA